MDGGKSHQPCLGAPSLIAKRRAHPLQASVVPKAHTRENHNNGKVLVRHFSVTSDIISSNAEGGYMIGNGGVAGKRAHG